MFVRADTFAALVKQSFAVCLAVAFAASTAITPAVCTPNKQAAPTNEKARPSPGKNLSKTIATNGRPKVIDVGAVWCIPCKKLHPIFEKLKTTYAGKADFESMDFDKPQSKPFLKKFDIESLPTVCIFDASGKLVWKESSERLTEQEIASEINKVVH